MSKPKRWTCSRVTISFEDENGKKSRFILTKKQLNSIEISCYASMPYPLSTITIRATGKRMDPDMATRL